MLGSQCYWVALTCCCDCDLDQSSCFRPTEKHIIETAGKKDGLVNSSYVFF